MVIIKFLGPIKRESMELEAKNLSELKAALSSDSELIKWLKISAIAVNDTIASDLNQELKDGDIISVLPPVCGG